MGYSISLRDPVTHETLRTAEKHHIRGGTYVIGGTDDMWLHITYNYSRFFRKVIDEGSGIRLIYGKTGAESIPILQRAIAELGDDVDDNYWKPTEGNAKRALCGLLAFAQMRPDGVWDGD